MNEKLLIDLVNLKEILKKSNEYEALSTKNQKLEESDEVKLLSYKKDMAIMNYEDALKHYDKNSLEVLSAEKAMSKAIYDLNNHPLVKEYNLAYRDLNEIYLKINHELFSFYKGTKL
jgi:Protein of unknown function (DUF964).